MENNMLTLDNMEIKKCKICGSDIVGETIMPEFNWKSSVVCENGHWYLDE